MSISEYRKPSSLCAYSRTSKLLEVGEGERVTGNSRKAESVKAGERAPEFEASAAGSGREITLASFSGRRAILMFHGSSGAGEAVRINRLVRQAGYTARELMVASVVDLSAVPLFTRAAVAGYLSGRYRAACAEVPPGAEPEEYVIILPDWSADVTVAFGASGAGSLEAFLLNEDGIIEERYERRQLLDSLLHVVQSRRP